MSIHICAINKSIRKYLQIMVDRWKESDSHIITHDLLLLLSSDTDLKVAIVICYVLFNLFLSSAKPFTIHPTLPQMRPLWQM